MRRVVQFRAGNVRFRISACPHCGKSDRRVFVSQIFLLIEAAFGFRQICVHCALSVSFSKFYL